MIPVRQSTAFELSIGPVLDADGVAVTDCVVGDFKIKKTTGNFAALNGSATLAHVSAGTYDLVLTTSDVDTVGLATIAIDDTVNACASLYLQVIEEAVYDRDFAAASTGIVGTAQTGDSYAIVNSGTHGNAALKTLIDAVDNFIDTEITDIGNRLPAALVSGRIDASVGAMAADVLTAAAAAADFGAEIADAVWDEDATAHQASGSFGLAVGDPFSGPSIYDIALTLYGAYDSGTSTISTNALYINGVPGQASIRAAVGLASANLDAQLDAVPTAAENANAVWDEATSGHTTGGTFGEQLKTDVDAILSAVDTEIAAILAAVDTEIAAIQSTLSSLFTTALTESYRADGATGSVAQLLYEINQTIGERSFSGIVGTVKKIDGSTTAFTQSLDNAGSPTSINRAT